jgi:hypothetical protein
MIKLLIKKKKELDHGNKVSWRCDSRISVRKRNLLKVVG